MSQYLFIFIVFAISPTQAFFFGNSGCGCGAPPACPPPPPPPVCPAAPSCGGSDTPQLPPLNINEVQPVYAQAQAIPPVVQQNYVNAGQPLDGQIAQEIQIAEAEAAKGRVKRDEGEPSFDPKCNSEILRDIILKNIHASTSTAKRQIQAAAAEEIGGRVDAICSTGTFSYIVNTEVYCETEKNGVTCFVFKQSE
ncbi:unnamed protein product [Auanema sp. JU1783]|nr:unnamed protein product [Auanema sp. JU1783]